MSHGLDKKFCYKKSFNDNFNKYNNVLEHVDSSTLFYLNWFCHGRVLNNRVLVRWINKQHKYIFYSNFFFEFTKYLNYLKLFRICWDWDTFIGHPPQTTSCFQAENVYNLFIFYNKIKPIISTFKQCIIKFVMIIGIKSEMVTHILYWKLKQIPATRYYYKIIECIL